MPSAQSRMAATKRTFGTAGTRGRRRRSTWPRCKAAAEQLDAATARRWGDATRETRRLIPGRPCTRRGRRTGREPLRPVIKNPPWLDVVRTAKELADPLRELPPNPHRAGYFWIRPGSAAFRLSVAHALSVKERDRRTWLGTIWMCRLSVRKLSRIT